MACVLSRDILHIEAAVRTNIDLPDELMAEAMAATGLPTKKAVVEEALRELVKHRGQVRAIEALRGLGWDGDLDTMRRDIDDDPHA